ncbi:MAG: CPBP family intramembrane metalloprotease [Labilithrix sp.]|nr:CPBP family intramembrane metalloprotease [Labilithrix sp.]
MDSLPPSERKDRPLSFAAAALWTLLALFLYVFFLGMTEAAREGAVPDLVSRTACQALAYSIVFFGILRLHEPETSIRHVLALRAPSALAVILALTVGAAMSLPSEWLGQVLDAKLPRPPEEQQELDSLLAVTTVGKRVTLFVTLVVLAPIFDELFFRGVLFTPLKRTQRAETVIVATAAFETLGSLNSRAMLMLLVATLVFAWIRGLTGSVIPSILARMAYYGVAIVPICLGRDGLRPTPVLLAVSGGVGVVGLVGLSLLGRRDARSREARELSGD